MTPYAALERLGQCPSMYAPSDFFYDYIRSFLPPIYMDVAEKLSEKQRINFVEVWAWESNNLLTECGLLEELGQVRDYLGRPHEPRPMGFSSQLSEVYRSAFLRTLAWFRQLGQVEETDFWGNSARACPIDLSLWSVQCITPPHWWPRFNRPADTAEQFITLGDWDALRQVHKVELEQIDGRKFQILAAEGPCLMLEDSPQTSVQFSLIGFAYRRAGPSTPDAKEVARYVDQRAHWFVYPQSGHLLAALDPGNKRNFIPGDLRWRLEDLEVVSLVAQVDTPCTNLWQWYRGYHAMWFPSAFFCKANWEYGYDDASWFLSHDNRKLAIGQDWRLGILEELDDNTFPPHGQFLIIDSAELDRSLNGAGLRLGHLLAVQVKTQKYSYEKAEKFDYVELVGVSNILV